MPTGRQDARFTARRRRPTALLADEPARPDARDAARPAGADGMGVRCARRCCKERLGGTLDAGARLRRWTPEALEAVFREKPALHRYPGSMAKRAHALAAYLVEHYDGRAENVWRDAATGDELLARVQALPGFGTDKARIFVGLLGKRLGVRPPGWETGRGRLAVDRRRRHLRTRAGDPREEAAMKAAKKAAAGRPRRRPRRSRRRKRPSRPLRSLLRLHGDRLTRGRPTRGRGELVGVALAVARQREEVVV